MPNSFFQFKQFIIHQDQCAMKVTTDSCLFGAWVAEQLKDNSSAQDRLIDIGTGTGLLSLMIAQQCKVSIDAIELDSAAATQATSNIGNSPFASYIKVIEADARLFETADPYSFLVSNPPFYENELGSPDSKRKLAHHDGGLSMDELYAIIDRALSPEGQFFLLLPYKRLDEIRAALARCRFSILQLVFVQASLNHAPTRIMLHGKKVDERIENAHTAATKMTIRNTGNEYSSAFIHLLQPYYLHL